MAGSPGNHGVRAVMLWRPVRLRDTMRTVVEDLEDDDHDGYILEDCLFFVAILLKREIMLLSVNDHMGSNGTSAWRPRCSRSPCSRSPSRVRTWARRCC